MIAIIADTGATLQAMASLLDLSFAFQILSSSFRNALIKVPALIQMLRKKIAT